jgi:bifunctional non-homologous end joining protein LigD
MAEAQLARYRQMRDFTQTAEPSGNDKVVPSEALRFVIQKHAASHLHSGIRRDLPLLGGAQGPVARPA